MNKIGNGVVGFFHLETVNVSWVLINNTLCLGFLAQKKKKKPQEKKKKTDKLLATKLDDDSEDEGEKETFSSTVLISCVQAFGPTHCPFAKWLLYTHS